MNNRLSRVQDAVHPLIGCYSSRHSPLLQRFYSKVRALEDGCWEWIGHRQPNGYGQICRDYKVEYAHRIAWELVNGPIPAGMHIDHLCNNRACVRAGHLEAVTQAENNQRMWDRKKGRV